MPETFIIYRRIYDADLRTRLADRYTTRTENDNDLANEWRKKFKKLSSKKREFAEKIIGANKFKPGDYECNDPKINDILSYYAITR